MTECTIMSEVFLVSVKVFMYCISSIYIYIFKTDFWQACTLSSCFGRYPYNELCTSISSSVQSITVIIDPFPF